MRKVLVGGISDVVRASLTNNALKSRRVVCFFSMAVLSFLSVMPNVQSGHGTHCGPNLDPLWPCVGFSSLPFGKVR